MRCKRTHKTRRRYRKTGQKELVVLRTKIDGQHKVAISDVLLDEIKGKPWHWGRARISAITGRPFSDVVAATGG